MNSVMLVFIYFSDKLWYIFVMKPNNVLFSKNGMATQQVAIKLLQYAPGDKIPTISELSESLNLARGTVQNAIFTLEETKAIKIHSRGILGSFLEEYDINRIMEIVGINVLLGAMPLPYTKRLEGLAYGLIQELEKFSKVPVHMGYDASAENRVDLTRNRRYDFAVTSLLFAQEYLKEHDDMEIILRLGKKTISGGHLIVFSKNNSEKTEIEDGMKVGIAGIQVVHSILTRLLCEGKDVTFVPMNYSAVKNDLDSGRYDCVILNVDEHKHFVPDYRSVSVTYEDGADTEAVILILKRFDPIAQNIIQYLSVDNVVDLQNRVLNGEIFPNY